mgnify:CR=1 FL=1
MLHIAICDDECVFVDHLTELLNQYAVETGENIKVTAYYDGLELIEKYDPSIDLIFLDIHMKLANGFRTAECIRQRDEKVSIIFLTSLSQYGLEGYKYQATNYIIKPIQYVRLKDEMNQWLKRHRKERDPSIIVSNNTGRYKVLLNSLSYVETFGRNLLLHTEQGDIICYKSMKEMESELQDKGFARCHTSYLVNFQYVKNANGKDLQVKLITCKTIPISQPKRKEFMEKLADYWGEML